MIFNLLSTSAWKLLLFVSYSPGSGYTRGELLRLMEWNNLSLDRTLKRLLFYKILQKKGRVIKLNFAEPSTIIILDLIEQEKKRLNFPPYGLFLVVSEFVRMAEGQPIQAIYLFGSWAKKTAARYSDIDLAVFSQEGLDLSNVQDAIEQKKGVKLQVHYFKDLKSQNPLIKNILKEGVMII
ncbi:MAG: nucleotidyltransferase domain-containing protein [Candidatus Woesearchaeota archaeon]